MINNAIESLIKGEKLDLTTLKEAFDEIFSGLADLTQASAFITALKINDLTQDELVSSVICANDTFKNDIRGAFLSSDNAIITSTFNENKDIFDINLAVDLVCAASGLKVFKQSLISANKIKKSFKILNLMGLKIEESFAFKDEIVETDFLYAYLPSTHVFSKYCSEILANIKFDNILNFIYKMLNPYGIKNIMIGVNDKDKVNNLANICLNLSYSNSMVIGGFNGLEYVSIEGDTLIAEAWKNKIFTYVLNPKLLDIEPKSDENLKAENIEQEVEILEKVFKNKEKNCYYDAIVLNSAMALYISKKAASIVDAIAFSKKTIEDNKVQEKIEQIKKAYK